MRLLVFVLLFQIAGTAQTARPAKRRANPAAAPAPVKQKEEAKVKQKEEAKAWPIASLSVEGNRTSDSASILAVTGLKIGQVAGQVQFDAARDRLLATGMFDTVGYRFGPSPSQPSQFAATFEVTEVAQIFPYRFDALPGDAGKLRAVLQQQPLVRERIPATEPVLKRLSQTVEKHLADAGHPATVIARLQPDESNQLVVVFRPPTLPSVAEVTFTGNKLISATVLQQAVAGAAVGAVYTEPRFRQILDLSVRPLYEKQGHIAVAFPELRVSPAKDVNGLVVTVAVQEGEPYKLGKVAIAGEHADNDLLLKEGKFGVGEVADFSQIQVGLERMRDKLKRGGYLYAKVDSSRKPNHQAKTVDVVAELDPGPRFTFGKLTIQGLDIQSEPQIRKLWAMKEGQAYNAEYPAYFLRRVKDDGVFENLGKTASLLKTDDSKKVVDVTLTFSTDGKPLPRIGPDAVEKPKVPDF